MTPVVSRRIGAISRFFFSAIGRYSARTARVTATVYSWPSLGHADFLRDVRAHPYRETLPSDDPPPIRLFRFRPEKSRLEFFAYRCIDVALSRLAPRGRFRDFFRAHVCFSTRNRFSWSTNARETIACLRFFDRAFVDAFYLFKCRTDELKDNARVVVVCRPRAARNNVVLPLIYAESKRPETGVWSVHLRIS